MRWKYTTLARLRDVLKIDATYLPDDAALDLISQQSEVVNQLTKQFFQPMFGKFRLDGNGSRLVNRRDLVPFCFFDLIELDWSKVRQEHYGHSRIFGRNSLKELYPVIGNVVDVTNVELTHKGRMLQMISGAFPPGFNDVIVTGACAWLEPRKKFVGELAVDLEEDAVEVELVAEINDSGYVEVGDFIVVMISEATMERPALVYVDQVQTLAGPTLTVDKVVAQTGLPIPAGAKVYSCGGVPSGIRDVTEALVLKTWAQDARNPNAGAVDPSLVVSESTDGYSYSLGTSASGIGGGGGAGGLGLITGSVRLDKVLQSYQQPVYVGFA